MASEYDNPSPYLRANWWSRFFLGWSYPLLQKCNREKSLRLEDLYNVPPNVESTELAEQLEANWSEEVKRHPHSPSLIRATLRTVRWRPFLIGLMFLPRELGTFVQSLLLVYLIRFFEPCSTMSAWSAWLLVLASSLTIFFTGVSYHKHVYEIMTYSMRMRVAYSHLIFRKMLRLSAQAMNQISSGEINNLLANDAGQIESCMLFVNFFWVVPMDLALVAVLLWFYVKYITTIVIGYAILVILSQFGVSRLILMITAKTLRMTDARVKMISEIIHSMRIIKMHCWESAFIRKINAVRRRELTYSICRSAVQSIEGVMENTYSCVAFFLMYMAMWMANVGLDVRIFAVASCLIYFLQSSVMRLFGYALHGLVKFLAARNRIEKFLLLDEVRCRSVANGMHESAASNVTCKIIQARWNERDSFALRDIHFEARPGDLLGIIGPVGSGKSSLLQALCGEITEMFGTVTLPRSLCYVPQEPWIFSSTIKENILFGQVYNDELFRRVVNVTALAEDFTQLPNGENTLVGERGVMLSGGQKARVNLARALYRDVDVYLLDDPLAAVDVKVGRHVMQKAVQEHLRGKICILATHQTHSLTAANRVIALNEGEARIVAAPTDDRSEENPPAEMVDPPNSSLSNVKEESKQEGSVGWPVYLEYIRTGVGLVIGLVSVLVTCSLAEVMNLLSTWWLAKWSEEEGYRNGLAAECSNATSGTMGLIRSMSEAEWNARRKQWFYVYSSLVLVVMLSALMRTLLIKLIAWNASRVLHNQIFRRLMHTSIAFFDTTPAGQILNRLIKDIDCIDHTISGRSIDILTNCFGLARRILFVGWLVPWSFIPTVIAILLMFYVARCFTRTLRDLNRLQGTSRSPVYSHLNESIHGLKVIRSYGAERRCFEQFAQRLDRNTRACHLTTVIERWGTLRLDWITSAFFAVVAVFVVLVHTYGNVLSAADLALIFSYTVSLIGNIQWATTKLVLIEADMTSVERVLEYRALEEEPSQHRLLLCWPSAGAIVFENVSVTYATHGDGALALRHISLSIAAGEKLGIVGRTGAGKSSLVQTLFRMATVVDGRILIDGVDIATVGLADVRGQISVIPQDPVLFTGTIRANLDPFGVYSDTEIWRALEQVQLRELVTNRLPDGLRSNICEGGSNLSVGEKQLICLARAILKKNCRILIVDEAAANLDFETDERIQRAIHDVFKHCTVLTIAHRLRTVINSDRILVLDRGEVRELDRPDVLLNDPRSHFSSLFQNVGAVESMNLRRLITTQQYNNILEKNEQQPLLSCSQ